MHSTGVHHAPDRLGTNIPASGFSDPEKHGAGEKPVPEGNPIDDEDIDDIDALIDDLESQDGEEDYGDDDAAPGTSARPVPEDLLQTDTRTGLTSAEVDQRRRKYGLNQMKEEKENLILKFLMYFVGPIQFVMEVYLSKYNCVFLLNPC
jgi:H+-transporting ATPase